MQILASMDNSEQWQQVVESCQLESWNPVDNIKDLSEGQSVTSAFCIKPALTIAQLIDLLNLPDVNVLLSMSAAEVAVGELLEQGCLVEEALESWQEKTASILQLQSQHRRSLQLVQTESVLSNPSSAPDWLCLALEPADEIPSFKSNVHNLLAAQALRQHSGADRCWKRLMASSLPLSEQPQLSFDINTVRENSLVSKEKQIAQSDQEISTLHDQLFKVQEELEQALLKKQTLTKQLTDSEKNTQKQLSEMKAQLAEKNDENELILKQLFKVQEEFEQVLNEKQSLQRNHQQLELAYKQLQLQSQKELKKLENKLQVVSAEGVHAKHQLAAIQADVTSGLWKSITPVRQFAKVLKGGRLSKQVRNQVALVAASEYFDATWYLLNYPDVVESGVNPAEHYVMFGAVEGRSPGPLFDGIWYLSQYPDVAESGANPLLHYILFGEAEGRTASLKLLQHFEQPKIANAKDITPAKKEDKAAD